MNLPHEIKTIIDVTPTHFENFVREKYNTIHYNFLVDQNCKGNKRVVIDVPSDDYIDNYENHKKNTQTYIKNMIENNQYSNITSHILDDLYEKNLIVKGTYQFIVHY
jgi:hypothetical protein